MSLILVTVLSLGLLAAFSGDVLDLDDFVDLDDVLLTVCCYHITEVYGTKEMDM